MKKTALSSLIAMVLCASALPSAYAQTYSTMSGSEAHSLLTTLGMDPEPPAITEEGNVKIRFDDGSGNSTVFLTGCDSKKRCQRIQTHSGYSMSNKPTLELINEWNSTKIFSRAYLDEDRDPHLEADLDLDGGVTRNALKEFFRTYRVSVKSFRKHIDFN